jgi:hypothetical protein
MLYKVPFTKMLSADVCSFETMNEPRNISSLVRSIEASCAYIQMFASFSFKIGPLLAECYAMLSVSYAHLRLSMHCFVPAMFSFLVN